MAINKSCSSLVLGSNFINLMFSIIGLIGRKIYFYEQIILIHTLNITNTKIVMVIGIFYKNAVATCIIQLYFHLLAIISACFRNTICRQEVSKYRSTRVIIS